MKNSLRISWLLLLAMFLNGLTTTDAFADKNQNSAQLKINHHFEKNTKLQTSKWQLMLEFNKPVALDSLHESIEFRVNGKKMLFFLKKSFKDKRHLSKKNKLSSFWGSLFSKQENIEKIVVTSPDYDMLEGDHSVVIKKGLKDASENFELNRNYVVSFMVKNNSFTIEKIDAPLWFKKNKRAIDIHFSDDVYLSDLRKSFQIIPSVNISWHRSKDIGEGVFRLYGGFNPGERYNIKIKAQMKGRYGQVYTETINNFQFPDNPSKIIFSGTGSVLERKSRQMIHTRLVNVDELLVKSLSLPPASIPFILNRGRTDNRRNLNRDRTGNRRNSRDGKRRPASIPFMLNNVRTPANAIEKRVSEILDREIAHFLEVFKSDDDFSSLVREFRTESKLFFTHSGRNEENEFSVPLSYRERADRGECTLVIASNNKKDASARSTAKLFRITDLSISYKTSPKSLLTWITSLNTGKPIPGVRVFAATVKWDFYFLGKTNKQGVLLVRENEERKSFSSGTNSFSRETVPLNEVKCLIAVTDDDVSYIETGEGVIKPKGIKSATKSPDRDRFYKGHVFTERGVYRPGETVHFKGTLRQYQQGEIQLPQVKDIQFVIKNAKNEVVLKENKKASEFGTASGTFLVKSYYPLGRYTLFMRPTQNEGNGRKKARVEDYARVTFQVEEFRPPRHEVEVSFKKEESEITFDYVGLKKKNHFLSCTLEGKYYTGGPVQNGKVHWKVYYTGSNYKVEGFEEYSFSHPMLLTRELVETGESMLDHRGKLSVRIPIGKDVFTGNYGLEVVATVIDIDGRPATGKAVYQHDPQYLVGISHHSSKINIGEKQRLQIIVLDDKRKKIKKGTITVDVMREGHSYIQKRNLSGGTYWENKKIWKKDFSTSIPLMNGEAVFDFDFSRGGTFLVRFSYLSAEGHLYNSGNRYEVQGPGYYDYHYYDRPEKDSPERFINLHLDKSSYQIGEDIKLYASSNRKLSSCLLTIEREGILEHRLLKPDDDNIINVNLAAKKEYLPNVYISLIGTTARGEFPVYGSELDKEAPSYAYGYVNVKINKKNEDMVVGIGDENRELKAEPGQEVTINLSARDSSGKGIVCEMAVCVVDEGVLALTRFITPRLDSLIQFTYPLMVYTRELRNLLLLQTPFGFLHNEPLTGGGGLSLGKKRDPVTTKLRKDFSPVAYFNPSVITDEAGTASVQVRFPDTMTSYRVYAVACDKGGKFASSERLFTISKDFYIEPGIPRFMTKGDKARLLVSVFNKTDQEGVVDFSAETNENIRLSEGKEAYSIGEYERVAIPLKCDAQKAGMAELTFAGNFKDMSDAITVKLPVNLGLPLENKVIFGKFQGTGMINYELPEVVKSLPVKEIGPDDIECLLTISGTPFLKLSEGLKYLLKYPYGCIEQTSSRVLPLAALQDIIRDGHIPQMTTADTEKYLNPGVERILSMQTQSGGFGYWPGNRRPHKWGTIYGMTALTLSKQAGILVPQNALDKACKYLEKEILNSGKEEYVYKAYSALILAQNNKLTRSVYRGIRSDFEKMPQEAQLPFLWAGKIVEFDEQKILVERLSIALQNSTEQRRYWGFYAPYRRRAVALLASKAILGEGSLVDDQVQKVLSGIGPKGIWSSTSDTGWCLAALGEYFRGTISGAEATNLTISQAGQEPHKLAFEPGKSITVLLDGVSLISDPGINVEADTDKTLTYKLFLKYPRKDYSENGYSRGFTIEKTLENTHTGKPIQVGDVVKVNIRITVPERMNYIVLDDPLPAGLVAVNTALKTEEPDPGKENKDDESRNRYRTYDGYYRFTPNFFEMRDDRVLVFKDSCWSGSYQYSYYARAICEGEFIVPASKVQQMYEPDNCAYAPQTIIKIEAMSK